MNRYKPLLTIDESVRHQLGPDRSQRLEYFEIAQYSSKNLCEKIEKFLLRDISKIKANLLLDTEVTEAWANKPTEEFNEYDAKTTQFLSYFAGMGYFSISSYLYETNNLIVPPEFIASYILMKTHYNSLENTLSWLKDKKVSPRQAKKTALAAKSLINEIHKLISMKLPNDNGLDYRFESRSPYQKYGESVAKLSRQKDNITFWHREFAKRKFYLDVKNDESLENNINTLLDYILNVINNHNIKIEPCTSCRLINKDLFWENFHSSHEIFTRCCSHNCEINSILTNNTFSALNENIRNDKSDNICKIILLNIYNKYKYYFTDLYTRCDPDWIGTIKTKQGYLPHYQTHEDIIFKKNIDINSIHLSTETNPDVLYKKMTRKYIQEKITDPNLNQNDEYKIINRYIEKNDSNIIGLWLWDQINIFDTRIEKICTTQDIINIFTDSEWYKNLNVYQKYKSKIEKYKKSKAKYGKNNIIDSLIIEHRNDYIRVNESILSGYILTTEEALTRSSRQNK